MVNLGVEFIKAKVSELLDSLFELLSITSNLDGLFSAPDGVKTEEDPEELKDTKDEY